MIEIVNFTLKINKAGQQSYLNQYEEPLVVASANIEGVHGLPLELCSVAQQLKNIIKADKYRFGFHNIKNKSSIRYFREVIKCVNKKEDGH